VIRGADRILTTHAGSLARPSRLLELLAARAQGRPYDAEELDRVLRQSVRELVQRQAQAGIDIVSDGEQSKSGFFSYVQDRLQGLEPASEDQEGWRRPWASEVMAFPRYYDRYFQLNMRGVGPMAFVCTGPITYVGHDLLRRDIENLRAAMEAAGVTEAFLPSTAPRVLGPNRYYPSEEAYLEALAEALREEYRLIIDAGLILQIDDPGLTDILGPDLFEDPRERRREAERHIEILNHALRGLPRGRIRFHTCYGINQGPRIHEATMAEVAEHMLKVRAGAYSFEAINGRHQHEWRVWQQLTPSEEVVLIPGLISHTTNVVEHPALIADLLVTYAGLVGRDHVMAGSECGFSSQATSTPEIDPEVVWAKFQALAEGARRASSQLWP
jgi:5-methyltetrahydropteroyltriglutamate--homocysteine methyltransferase